MVGLSFKNMTFSKKNNLFVQNTEKICNTLLLLEIDISFLCEDSALIMHTITHLVRRSVRNALWCITFLLGKSV